MNPPAVTAATLRARLAAAQVASAANPRPANQSIAVVNPLPNPGAGNYLAASTFNQRRRIKP